MKVVPLSQAIEPPSSPPKVRGRGLTARKLSKTQLALLGAEIKEGAAELTDMSARQLAAVLRGRQRALAARRRGEDRSLAVSRRRLRQCRWRLSD
jgi:hypothetical protein